MLTKAARNAFRQVLRIGCFFRICPFRWDNFRNRLNPKITKWDELIFNLHGIIQCFMVIFSMVRFWLGLKEKEMPPRIRIMSLVWILAYILGIQIFFQFVFHRRQIVFFTNTLLHYIDESKVHVW